MKKVIVFILIIVSIELLALSCTDTAKAEEGSEFYYYPERNVYFDVENKNFFYSLDGAKSWGSIVSASAQEPRALGKRIAFRSTDRNVYMNNEEHRKVYGGLVHDYIKEDTATVTTTAEAGERKVITKVKTSIKPQPEEKPKKGIGKFISKIFGKKKKK